MRWYWALRSISANLLTVSRMKLDLRSYAFCVSAPTVWNSTDNITHLSDILKHISSRLPLTLPPPYASWFIFFTHTRTRAHTHTHPFNGPLSRTTWVSQGAHPLYGALSQRGLLDPVYSQSRFTLTASTFNRLGLWSHGIKCRFLNWISFSLVTYCTTFHGSVVWFGSVEQWLGHWICNFVVASLTPGCCADRSRASSSQPCASVTPSSINSYQWKRGCKQADHVMCLSCIHGLVM